MGAAHGVLQNPAPRPPHRLLDRTVSMNSIPTIHKLGSARAALVSAVVIAAAPLLLSACGNDAAQAAGAHAAAAAPQVSVAEVVQRPITDYSEFTGRIEAVERVELRPRVSGYIDSVT